MASVCTLPLFRFDDLPWHHPLTPPRPLRGWACRCHCWPPPLPHSHPLCRPGRGGCRQRRGVPAPPASRIGSGAVPPVPAWVQRGLRRLHRRRHAAATGVSLLLPLACAKCYDRTSFIRRYVGLHHFLPLSFLTLKPMYDTIWCLVRVRYDLVSRSCTIRSCVLVGYDVILRLVSVRYQSQSHIYYDT